MASTPEGGPQQKALDAANDGSAQQAASDPQAELAAARAQVAENYDLYLRARAELENVRRRGQEEIAKAQKYAIESFAESLVAV